MSLHRDTYAEINLKYLKENIETTYKKFKRPLMAVIKADASGKVATANISIYSISLIYVATSRYPVALMGSTLDSEKVSTIDGTTNHILKFTGDKNFTVIETPVTASEEVAVETVSGEVIDLVDGVAFYNDG